MVALRILVGDDHPLFRKGLKDLLDEAFAPAEIIEAESGADMLALAQGRDWDIAIMDITMPGKSGPELLHELKEARPALPVLVMSTHPEDLFAVRMFRAGASGYMTKAAAADKVVEAIKTILSGHKYISHSAAEQLAATVERDSKRLPHELLSDREFQVLCMLASGLNLRQIGEQLCVSANTVSTYRARILEKMNLKTNAELTRYAIQYSLIAPIS
jgi:two-component system invasion response regulator UvrY